jgi:hypothetical protein
LATFLEQAEFVAKLIQAAKLSIKIPDNVSAVIQDSLYHQENAIHKLLNQSTPTAINLIQTMFA